MSDFISHRKSSSKWVYACVHQFELHILHLVYKYVRGTIIVYLFTCMCHPSHFNPPPMKPNGCWWFSPLRARCKQGRYVMASREIRMDFPKINATCISSLITNRLLFFWESDQWTACHKRHLDKSWQQPSTQRIPIAVITDKTIENELIVSIIGNPPEYPPHSPSLSLYLTLMAWELKLFYNEGFPTAYSSHYAHMPTNTHTHR